MTRGEILAMARAAGLQRTNPGEAVEVIRFAEMVAAKEREACAQVCDGFDTGRRLTSDHKAEEMAAAIRARGKKEGT